MHPRKAESLVQGGADRESVLGGRGDVDVGRVRRDLDVTGHHDDRRIADDAAEEALARVAHRVHRERPRAGERPDDGLPVGDAL